MATGILNLKYLISVQGILKITQLIFLLVAFLLVSTSRYTVHYVYAFFQVVTFGVFITIFLFLTTTALGLPDKVPSIPWSVTEFILDTVALLCVFPISCAVAVRSYDVPVLVAASILGLIGSFLMTASVASSFRPVYSKMSPHISGKPRYDEIRKTNRPVSAKMDDLQRFRETGTSLRTS